MNASPSQFSSEEPAGSGLPENIRQALRRIIRQDLLSRLAVFPMLLAIILPPFWIVRALIDRVAGISWSTRLILLAADAAIVGALVYCYVYRACRRKLNLSTAALLVERKMPAFRTSLISAVELSDAGEASGGLVRKMVAAVSKKVDELDIVRGVSDWSKLKRLARWAILTLLILGVVCWYFSPASGLLAGRIFLSSSALPSLTKVTPITMDMLAVAGADVEVSARAEGVLPRSGKLVVSYEDGRTETVGVMGSERDPGLFSYTIKNVRSAFRYHFEINDGKGGEYGVALRVAPSVRSIAFTQAYPKYTGLPEAGMQPGSLALLAGGTLRIKGEALSSLKSAALELKGLEQSIPMKIAGDSKRELEAEIPIESGLTGLSIHLEDEKGERSENDPVYRVQLLNDKAPVASMPEPKVEKTTVVVNDQVSIAYSVRDDYGIRSIDLAYEVLRVNPDGQLSLAERGKIPLEKGTNPLNARGKFTWDLTTLLPPLTVGSSVLCWVEACDFKEGSVAGKSKAKRLLVVSEEEKKNELLKSMQEKAESIQNISKGQGTINQSTDDAIRAP